VGFIHQLLIPLSSVVYFASCFAHTCYVFVFLFSNVLQITIIDFDSDIVSQYRWVYASLAACHCTHCVMFLCCYLANKFSLSLSFCLPVVYDQTILIYHTGLYCTIWWLDQTTGNFCNMCTKTAKSTHKYVTQDIHHLLTKYL